MQRVVKKRSVVSENEAGCLSFKLAVVGWGSLLRGGHKDRFAVNINSDVSLTPKIELHTVREFSYSYQKHNERHLQYFLAKFDQIIF
jgi:hypothetical protein